MPVETHGERPSTSLASASVASGAANADAQSGGARAVAQSNDLYEFEYSYPAEAGRIPGLRALLDRRLADARTALEESAQRDRQTAEQDDYPFRQHWTRIEWDVVANLPRFLSLSAEIGTYSGGAHGNSGYDSLVWDRETGTALEPMSFFRSPAALENAIGGRYCTALNELREERRGEPVDPDGEGYFNDCPAISELTVLLGSSDGDAFDRIGLVAAPYVAGSYAEGAYEVTLGVDTAVLDAVKPEYRGAFALRR